MNGTPTFEFAPGQFNMLYVFGKGEVPISISGDPLRPNRLIHTVRGVGAVTKAICGFKRDSVIGVRGPFGSSWPIQETEGKDVVIVPGGMGLARLRPAIYQILSQRRKLGRIALLYGSRTPKDILYSHELHKWRGEFALNMQVEVTVDIGMGDWAGHVGLVTSLLPSALFDPANAIAMISGPEIIMRLAVKELQDQGMLDENIYISLERNMKCGVRFCGHCQIGAAFVCKDGPVFRYDQVRHFLQFREV